MKPTRAQPKSTGQVTQYPPAFPFCFELCYSPDINFPVFSALSVSSLVRFFSAFFIIFYRIIFFNVFFFCFFLFLFSLTFPLFSITLIHKQSVLALSS